MIHTATSRLLADLETVTEAYATLAEMAEAPVPAPAEADAAWSWDDADMIVWAGN